MAEASDVEPIVMFREEWDEAVERALAEVGLTYNELADCAQPVTSLRLGPRVRPAEKPADALIVLSSGSLAGKHVRRPTRSAGVPCCDKR